MVKMHVLNSLILLVMLDIYFSETFTRETVLYIYINEMRFVGERIARDPARYTAVSR